MKVDKAIEYLENGVRLNYNSGWFEHSKEDKEIIELLKSLATRCQNYDALLDELKRYSQGLILVDDNVTPINFRNGIKNLPDTIRILEKKYLGGAK